MSRVAAAAACNKILKVLFRHLRFEKLLRKKKINWEIELSSSLTHITLLLLLQIEKRNV